MKRFLILSVAFMFCFAAIACSAAPAAETEPAPSTAPQATAVPDATASSAEPAVFSVSSAAIVNGVLNDSFGARGSQKTNGIPSRSLPLSFSNIPEGAACLALSMIDPDGGDWVHWLAVNVPAQDLSENASVEQSAVLIQGTNDFGLIGYGGPTPPNGTHTYVIVVYALFAPVTLESGFSLAQFQAAIEDKVLASAELTGDYAS